MPENLKLSQIGSSPLPPPFRGFHSPGVRKRRQIIFACYFRKSSVESGTLLTPSVLNFPTHFLPIFSLDLFDLTAFVNLSLNGNCVWQFLQIKRDLCGPSCRVADSGCFSPLVLRVCSPVVSPFDVEGKPLKILVLEPLSDITDASRQPIFSKARTSF